MVEKITKTEEVTTPVVAEVPEKKEEKKVEKKTIAKKDEAVAVGKSLHMSLKQSMALGRFIKNRSIDGAIADLERVILLKKSVPMKGEIPHRKGNMMSGRYPVEASKLFITILKALKGNATVNGMNLDNVRVYYASPSWAARPFRSGGRKGKRVNLILKAKEVENKKNG